MAEAVKAEKRVLKLAVPNKEWAVVALALTHEAKNLYNTCTFLIRQINSAYLFDNETKTYRHRDDLHEHQRIALMAFNRVIEQVNAKRRAKQNDKPRYVASLKPVMSVPPLYVVLDVTVLDNVAKAHVDHEGQIVYRRLPASASQQVVRSVIDVWKASLAAQRDFAKHPEKYTGRPQFPGFKPKDGHFPLEMPYAMMVRGLPKPAVLKSLGDVTTDQLNRFYAYDLKQAALTACEKRGWQNAKPQHIRIIAEGASKVKIEAVVALSRTYPEGSLLHRISEEHQGNFTDLKTVEDREKFILNHVRRSDLKLKLAGLDCGQTNIATVGFSTGHRAIVHSGDRPNEIVERYHQLMDKRLAACATPRMMELQRLKQELVDKGEKLGKAQRIELRKEQQKGFADPEYRNLAARLNHIKSDFEHKITTDIVSQCVKHGIDLIVIGKNKGWKSDIDSGNEQNRKFHAIAHARLISLIRYKAEAYGIAVITTEESYTSQSSFIDGDELPVHATVKSETKKEKSTTQTEADFPVPQHNFSGKRSAKNRTWFVRHNVVAEKRFSRIHADVNGAFNIIRKVFTNFCHHAGLTYKFTVRWISPRRGTVVPIACL
ncbi:IS200/IS605 family accessory protein TnpB-related protein [Rhizobium sp. MHM7A]|uniref:IS200/IS605 family accessory protein TnpB-related protein n=1 Tax=Rhizobium sp. MHM7A TaxID=2583233 RepID=UPI00110617AD|nr:IS200/IS605 family accessory protein TnpB-related protein [Rhizobium sp. MHM7A]TLX16103.1 IS200/IS605 family element transposase accessory protein TnpB [Rhizobium sp. MHM7A]